MLSRVADSLYWLDRYMERTDAMIRVLRTSYVLSFDDGLNSISSLRQLLNIFGYLPEEKLQEYEKDSSAAMRFLITDSTNPNSLRSIISKARENARGAQDHITKEVWEQVNQVYHQVNDPSMEKRLEEEPLKVIDQLTEYITLYYGVTASTMPRGNGWNLMNTGKFIERCLLTIDIARQHLGVIEYKLDESRDILYWRNLLLSLSGYELHLKTYRTRNHDWNVVDQVLFNPHFTRSVRYSLQKIKGYLGKIVEHNNPEGKELLWNQFGRMMSRIEYADMEQVQQEKLEEFLRHTRSDMVNFHLLLGKAFFSYH
jgi:uncharacterized alpha-E superfamily protein